MQVARLGHHKCIPVKNAEGFTVPLVMKHGDLRASEVLQDMMS